LDWLDSGCPATFPALDCWLSNDEACLARVLAPANRIRKLLLDLEDDSVPICDVFGVFNFGRGHLIQHQLSSYNIIHNNTMTRLLRAVGAVCLLGQASNALQVNFNDARMFQAFSDMRILC